MVRCDRLDRTPYHCDLWMIESLVEVADQNGEDGFVTTVAKPVIAANKDAGAAH
jgi:hypothetical protein